MKCLVLFYITEGHWPHTLQNREAEWTALLGLCVRHEGEEKHTANNKEKECMGKATSLWWKSKVFLIVLSENQTLNKNAPKILSELLKTNTAVEILKYASSEPGLPSGPSLMLVGRHFLVNAWSIRSLYLGSSVLFRSVFRTRTAFSLWLIRIEMHHFSLNRYNNPMALTCPLERFCLILLNMEFFALWRHGKEYHGTFSLLGTMSD